MNAAANGDNGGDYVEIVRLRAQRDQLQSEVDRLREQRNQAIDAANALQIENAQLWRRIEELMGDDE